MLNFEDLEGTGINKDKLYVGRVVDNNDPRHLSRVRVYVPLIFEGIEEAHLPWSLPSSNVEATPDSGVFDVPKVGSKVSVKFQGGSPDHPIYYPYSGDEQTILEEALVNYPFRKIRKFGLNTIVILDTRTNEIFINHKGGDAHLNFEDSNVILDIKNGNLNTKVDGDIVSKSKNYSIECDNYTLKAGKTTMESKFLFKGDTDFAEGYLKHESTNVGSTHVHPENDAAPSPTGGPQ